MRIVLSFLVVCAFILPAFAYERHGAYYRSSDGSLVHVPYGTSSHVDHEAALCRDGGHSVSHHHRGACSHHGGVAHWG